MTKSTITRERIELIANFHRAMTLPPSHAEIEELARIALAAMDSEPVAYIDKQWTLVYYVPPMSMGLKIGDKLYRHAQPAQVAYSDFEEFWSAYIHPLAQDDELKDFAWDIWNSCRAAMLAAAQHDTPALNPVQSVVTVPGKWIPVSERMPDDDDFVYIWPRPDFGVELHVGQYCECSPKGDGWYAQVYEQNYGIEWHPITVTHWMPLPAGPQEVKSES
ncbi:DUF551 domain-containing protein [Klebsiella pneumoniae]|uniref:DUF551 domain-containing protein n=2 Tax=Klebsiella pneumoniae complex TaxID=3390273 RepID=UPI0020A77145|nr:DUF551 domain-containing protein [Klebsiella pneumoniae]MCP3227082.1 DUF551 domain-containing protein [Klebsiella pneumoniae]MDS0124689.1 DUF551 domain-containing protein [Klebsiella pneumoniae]HBR1805158.1 DUF551 domain-containing protein [Klebsiella pneumoniae]HDK5296528.1 DUF551 domain-containing protein [Klebsiella pneumoniae]